MGLGLEFMDFLDGIEGIVTQKAEDGIVTDVRK